MDKIFEPRRPLGRTGFRATIIGSGDVADRALPIDACVSTLRRAIDAGVNVIDTAPNYEDGYSEEIVGRAVRGVRESLFIVDKIDHHLEPVMPQIDASLARLQLDSVDAFVFHNLSSMPTFEQLLEPGGGFDELGRAATAGKTRFRGISSHDPDVLLRSIDEGVCDVVMFPIGPFVDERYVHDVLPRARERGVGTICFKTFGAGKLVADTPGYNQPLQRRPRGKFSSAGDHATAAELPQLSVEECVHYTLTLDPDVALLGMSFPNEQDAAFAAVESFQPLGAAAMDDIRRRAVQARQEKGPCWWNPDPEA